MTSQYGNVFTLLEVHRQIPNCFHCHLEVRRSSLSSDWVFFPPCFCWASSTVVNIIRRDLSSGQMIWFALPLSFTLNHIHLRARKWLCSCHNWSTARRDGSACFCYYLFNLSQDRILNLYCIPLFLTDRCMINTRIKGSAEIAGFFEACLWSWICWANTVHTEPPLNKLVWLASSLFGEELSGF